MVLLELVSRIQTQALGWQHQEVQRCANELLPCEYLTVRAGFIRIPYLNNVRSKNNCFVQTSEVN